jgi:hypothetical protein
VGPRGLGAPGHDAGSLEGPLFATGDAGAAEEQPGLLDLDRAAVGVGEVGVPPVDEDVALRAEGDEFADEVVDGGARLDHHEDFAGRLEAVDQFLEGVAALEFLPRMFADELVDLRHRAVEDRHLVAPAFHVENEVLTHHRQAHETDIALRH